MKKWLIQNMRMMWLCKNKNPIFRRIVLAMLWDFGKTVSKAYILLRQNNWMHRNLGWKFNMTNVKELFQSLIELGQHPKEMADTVTVMEK
jgi:hypothetical protein